MGERAVYIPQYYNYTERTGNLKAEAAGVVKSEKHFPIFDGNLVFKPLTKSKPLSTPLFAYAEVFWSWVIQEYFEDVPKYQLAFCSGYEKETEKYYDYGTVVPLIYGEGEHLVNLLEFFRGYPDKKVEIDNYENYCQMFYDYTQILESDYFQKHTDMAEELAMQILISILKGDQNYHYENVAFICNGTGKILRLAPMLDHEFSTYFMFPDSWERHIYCLKELERSIEGDEVQPKEYAWIKNVKEREMTEKSAVCLNRNLLYIKEHYPKICEKFLEKLKILEYDLKQNEKLFYIQKSAEYPSHANSNAYLIGKARYRDHDEEKAEFYEKRYGMNAEEIDFKVINIRIILEMKSVARWMRKILEK